MANNVDHKQRRVDIAQVAAKLISRVGVQSLTMRSLAAETGCSTKVITHYFQDKRDLLRSIYRDAAMRTQTRIDAALAEDPANVEVILNIFLPLDEERMRDWRVYFAFWDLAMTDQELSDEQVGWLANAQGIILSVLEAREKQGISTTATIEDARRLLTLVQGVAVQMLFDVNTWSAERAAAYMHTEVQRFFREEQLER